MKHRHKKMSVLVALWGFAALALIWTFEQRRVTAAAEAEVMALRAARSLLEIQLRQQKQQAVAVAQELREMQTTLKRVQDNAGSAAGHSRRTVATKAHDPAALAMRDPVLQTLVLALERTALAGRYAPVVRKLGLTAPQIGKLEELIQWRNEQQMDLDDVVYSNGLSEQDPAVRRLRDKTARTFYAAVDNLIGQPAGQELIQHERALPVWELVNQFAGAVALEGNPLTETQATQLTETLAVSSPPYRDGGEADTDKIDWPVVLPAATKILTPPQQVSFLNMAPVYPMANPGGASGAPSLVGPPAL